MRSKCSFDTTKLVVNINTYIKKPNFLGNQLAQGPGPINAFK